ncbi:MAG: hypothetical protein PHU23_00565 [Dehalococcoidales bacterium]|nr:hypothetical protein [Dehalococcoidales bacterium]
MVREQRPPIPYEIKREVRQRCGFGCVICGSPLYEYEHMEGWAVVHRHVAEEITLLCDKHHSERTKGLLPKEDVVKANNNPYNKRSGISQNYLLHYSGDNVNLILADNVFSYYGLVEGRVFAPLVIDGLPMVGFKILQGKLFLNFFAFDQYNKPILKIIENELVYDTKQWDIEWIGQTLTIREERRIILLQLIFNPPDGITISKGRILRNGIEIIIRNNYAFVVNNGIFLHGNITQNVPVGFSIGFPIPNVSKGLPIDGVPRYNLDRQRSLQILRNFLIKHNQDDDIDQ